MPANIEIAKQLLEHVQTLHGLLQANRREPFNVFVAIRKSHDEVNLHSRFLHALLSHREEDGRKSNLEDFLSAVPETERFASQTRAACVQREYRHIDLLITHPSRRWAVIIENKIWARDQPKQLDGYDDTVAAERYQERAILYLTLDGREPEAGAKNVRPVCISYDEHIRPWLERCQQRAHADPALRESVAQYRAVVEQLTGRTVGGPYMDELTKLCERHLPLVMDLSQAIGEAKRNLLRRLWNRIHASVKARLGSDGHTLNRPQFKAGPDASEDRIENMLKHDRVLTGDWHCLLWPFRTDPEGKPGSAVSAPGLAVELNESGLIYGVRCGDDCHAAIKDALKSFQVAEPHTNDSPRDWWPWKATYTRGNRHGWRQLADLINTETKMTQCADHIAGTLHQIRDHLRSKGLFHERPSDTRREAPGADTPQTS